MNQHIHIGLHQRVWLYDWRRADLGKERQTESRSNTVLRCDLLRDRDMLR